MLTEDTRDKAQQVIIDWFNNHDFSQHFINWLDNNNESILEIFFKYCKSNIYQFEFTNKELDWIKQIKYFINHNKQLIYDKFKNYVNKNFNDWYNTNDQTEFNSFIEQEFIKFYKKEVPNMSIPNKDKFLSGYCLNLDQQIYNQLLNKFNISKFDKWDVIFKIRELLQSYIKQYKTDIEKIQSKSAKKLNKFCKDLIKAIKKDLNTFVANIKFNTMENGSYDFSLEDTNFHGNSRNDAIDIIQYLCNHKKIMQQLIPSVNIKNLEKKCNINLSDYFLDYYHTHYDESLQQVARKYLLELQKAIVNKRAQKLEDKNDDNRIGKLSTFKLNYNVTNDFERSAPALMCTNGNIAINIY